MRRREIQPFRTRQFRVECPRSARRRGMKLVELPGRSAARTRGPLKVTLDLLFDEEAAYRRALQSPALEPGSVALLKGQPKGTVEVLPYPAALGSRSSWTGLSSRVISATATSTGPSSTLLCWTSSCVPSASWWTSATACSGVSRLWAHRPLIVLDRVAGRQLVGREAPSIKMKRHSPQVLCRSGRAP
jgi:hypothetical protein